MKKLEDEKGVAPVENYGKGHGKPEKSTGPPRPASASSRLIITAIAASSLPSLAAPLVFTATGIATPDACPSPGSIMSGSLPENINELLNLIGWFKNYL